MKKMLIAFLIVLFIAGGAYYYTNFQNMSPQEEDVTLQETATIEENTVATGSTEVKEFKIIGKNIAFEGGDIRVKKGDTVRVVFTVEQGNHDWVIDEFNTRTNMLNTGETETVEFVADKAGTFEYYCSVPGHRLIGMKGNLIVEE